MAKVNFSGLPRPSRPGETRSFTDPEQPTMPPFELSLRRVDSPEMAVALDEARRLVEEFGGGIPMANGTAMPAPESLCQSVCLIAVMQCGPAETRYSAEELLPLFAVCPTAADEILAWAGQLNAKPGNSPRPRSEA